MFWLFIFIISCLVLFWAGSRLVGALARIARYLGWREFVVAFFVMAFASSAPNLFVGINSAIYKIPELSFGEIVGGNLVDLTLAVGLAVLLGGAALQVKSKMVQTSTIFTTIIVILPQLLILDHHLGRIDGLILLLAFFVYIFWLFSKEERFRKAYNGDKSFLRPKQIWPFRAFLKDLAKTITTLILLLLASWAVVKSAQLFSEALNIALPLVGILIVGVGNALPETYFAIASARKGQTWMILGDLMGSVIITATFVLGIVALIQPIEITDFSPFAIARIFLIISAIFFLIIVRTDKKITKKEALILILIYLLFVLTEIFFR